VIGGHQYYRDTQGYCYWVDSNGQPHYNYNVRC
jgi:L,D-peptidoglycan transpeptidase YkuD (ErfK/YbiS/YcfS/YnhG family)